MHEKILGVENLDATERSLCHVSRSHNWRHGMMYIRLEYLNIYLFLDPKMITLDPIESLDFIVNKSNDQFLNSYLNTCRSQEECI